MSNLFDYRIKATSHGWCASLFKPKKEIPIIQKDEENLWVIYKEQKWKKDMDFLEEVLTQ